MAPNANSMAPRGSPTAMTDPTRSGGSSTNSVLSSTPSIAGNDKIMSTSQSGPVTVNASYFQNQPTVLYHPQAMGQDQRGPHHNLAVPNEHAVENGYVIHGEQTVYSQAPVRGHHMAENHTAVRHMQGVQRQHMPQNQPIPPNQHMVQNQPNIHQYHAKAQFFGCSAPSSQTGGSATAPPRTLYGEQPWSQTQTTPSMSRAGPSTSSQPMARAVPPSQSEKGWRPTPEDIVQVQEWLDEGDSKFGHRIQNFRDMLKYKEAERRTRVKPTPGLAKDLPQDKAQQKDLAERLFNAFMIWRADTPGWTKQAINKVCKRNNFIRELTAWLIVVRYRRSRSLANVETY